VFDLQFNHDQWQLWGGMSGLLATVMVLPMIDLSQSWVVGAWLTLFIVQVAQRAWSGFRARFKDGSVEGCTLECPVMLPVGFLLRLKTVSAEQYAVPVLKADTEPCAYRRARVWLRFYPK